MKTEHESVNYVLIVVSALFVGLTIACIVKEDIMGSLWAIVFGMVTLLIERVNNQKDH